MDPHHGSNSFHYLPYFCSGTVVHGFERGSKKLGFPTVANLPSMFKEGVYFGFAKVDRGPIFPMVMSCGFNPQFKNANKSLEVHILRYFEDDFYGHELSTIVIGYIRAMQVFKSTSELIGAIESDIAIAKEELAKIRDECLTLLERFPQFYESLYQDSLNGHQDMITKKTDT